MTTKVQIDDVLSSIKKLSSQSYENGKTTLEEVDTKLQKIQNNAGEDAKNFQKFSDEFQKEYEQLLAKIRDEEVKQRQYQSTMIAGIPSFPIPLSIAILNAVFSDKLAQSYQYLKILEFEKQRLANGIVLTNKISKLCDNLEKRVNLAKQKSRNVKEYADALNSFSDPDILSEIAELNTFVADLTNNLTVGS